MKRSAIFLLICAVAGWSGCGGGGGSQTKPVSHIKDRVFVTNYLAGLIHIVDASKNQISQYSISTGSGPSTMIPSPDKKSTLVIDQGSNDLFPITNATETFVKDATSSIQINGLTESVVLASDNKTGYAAVRNYNNGAGQPLGAVQKFDYVTPSVTSTIKVPAARWLALNHAGTKLLVMTDVSDSVTIVDLTPSTPTLTPVAGFSRPVAAFFSSDDATAYVVNCGPECGGAQAGVQELVMSSGTLGRSVNLSSARVATMNGTTLYVAGSPNGSGGTAQSVDLSNFTASAPATIGIGDKQVIKYLASKVFIGSRNCANTGCLTMWDPAGNSVVIDNPAAGQNSKGDVTGFDLITSSNRLFVAEGGELRVYNLSLVEETTVMDVVGRAYDVQYVPQ